MTGFVEVSQDEMMVVNGGRTAADRASDAATSGICVAAAIYCVKSILTVAAVPGGAAIATGAAIGFAAASIYYGYRANH